MRLYSKMLLLLCLLFIASVTLAQEPYHSSDTDILARLSYDSSALLQGPGVSHICLAVSRDGEYRIIRSIENWPTLLLHGTMTDEQFQDFQQLLRSRDFRILLSHPGGLIRKDAESFHAEFPVGARMQADGNRQWLEPESRRMEWLNADGESPFPASIAKLVQWMQRFQPKNAKQFEYAQYPNVCPSGGLKFIQPTIADNRRP